MAHLEEFQHIEIVIELDKGRSIEAVAEQFGVSLPYIRKLAVEAGLTTPHKKKKLSRKKARLFEEDHEKIIERVAEGEELDSIALDFSVAVSTIRRLCKQEGVVIPRSLHHLKTKERDEIKDLLAANEPIEEIARAYNLAYAAIEQLQEEEYKQLNSDTLGYLYEIIIENKEASSHSLKKIANNEGYTISEQVILSYQNRLRKLKMI